jgi:hypothetical protein
MLKFESLAEVGSTIRAYDFKPMLGREDSFVEGRVTEKGLTAGGFKGFTIICTKDVFGGEVMKEGKDGSRVGQNVYIPFETSFMEYDARVIDLSSL